MKEQLKTPTTTTAEKLTAFLRSVCRKNRDHTMAARDNAITTSFNK